MVNKPALQEIKFIQREDLYRSQTDLHKERKCVREEINEDKI